ncbi:MAG: hypothetical protein R3321_06985, partial [Nitrososphaeraceae archaeon]|nr:hypothetical protein [Nitrososphaeraceae archaeon]
QEIVKDGINGALLEEESINALVKGLHKMLALSEQELYNLRQNAFDTWSQQFNAEKNYKDMINLLK